MGGGGENSTFLGRSQENRRIESRNVSGSLPVLKFP